ncbi:MAG: DUF91 domain-containing protein [Deltaproteobacteria bacterium]|nr:DUF91 domain-containing protein [Deltaproteobacteria bacterium]MBI3388325.1 DUF91 domain-containing protein [Deltaproteobacteria bacterium]
MKTYTKNDVSERELEDLVRCNAGLIEEGLVYVDHQKPTAGGRLDVLMVDSGKSLVVAELKVTQDDGMLLQGLDYYDYVSAHVESYARLYKAHSIDPTQQVRLFLVAPTFSQTLVNRCKWLDLPISLFTFDCLKFEGDDDVVPIFQEREITAPPEIIEVTHLEDHLGYITDAAVRAKVTALLEEIKNWKPGSISLDPIKYGISMKVNNRVFAYLLPRRKHYIIATFDADDKWKEYPVKGDDDLENVRPIMQAAMERRTK